MHFHVPPTLTGKISFARYLREKAGKQPTLTDRFINALSSKDNHAARSRIKDILDMVYATPTGRDLIENGAAGSTSIAFANAFPSGYARFGYNTVMVSASDADAVTANIISHELQHANQERAIIKAFGSNRYFYENAKAFGDTAYPMLIGEADAYVVQAIQAYEMLLNGHSAPWDLQKSDPLYKPLAQSLEKNLARGINLRSAAMRQSLFKQWLLRSPNRLVYEANYLHDLAQDNRLTNTEIPGVSHANEALIRIADDAHGQSPLSGLNLLDTNLLGLWKISVPAEHIFDLACRIEIVARNTHQTLKRKSMISPSRTV